MAQNHDADLIRMANQIADFFEPYPHDEALKGVKTHIEQFWEPRMRQQFDAIMDRGGDGLKPLALEAARLLDRKPEGAGA
jgi:formate dehydrogenase subunit delta